MARLSLFRNNTSNTRSHVDVCSIGVRSGIGVSPFAPSALYKATNPYAFQYLVTWLFHFNFPTLVEPAPRVGVGSVAVSGAAGRQTAAVHAQTRALLDLTGWTATDGRRDVVRDNCWLSTGRRLNSSRSFDCVSSFDEFLKEFFISSAVVRHKKRNLSCCLLITLMKWFSYFFKGLYSNWIFYVQCWRSVLHFASGEKSCLTTKYLRLCDRLCKFVSLTILNN